MPFWSDICVLLMRLCILEIIGYEEWILMTIKIGVMSFGWMKGISLSLWLCSGVGNYEVLPEWSWIEDFSSNLVNCGGFKCSCNQPRFLPRKSYPKNSPQKASHSSNYLNKLKQSTICLLFRSTFPLLAPFIASLLISIIFVSFHWFIKLNL